MFLFLAIVKFQNMLSIAKVQLLRATKHILKITHLRIDVMKSY